MNNAYTRWEIIGYREGLKAAAEGRFYEGSGILWEYVDTIERLAYGTGFDLGIRGASPLPCWGL